MEEDSKIYIQRGHGSNQPGCFVPLKDLHGVRWDNESGGIHRRQRGYSLYGYVNYKDFKNILKCSGEHDYGYNDMKVLIPRVKAGEPEYKTYKYLMGLAGPKPCCPSNRPKGMPPRTTQTLILLADGAKTRGCLRNELSSLGYDLQTFPCTIKALIKQEKIICTGSPNSKNQLIQLKK